MDDQAKIILKSAIEDYGINIIKEPARVEGLLKDILMPYSGEQKLIMLGLREAIPTSLLADKPVKVILDQLQLAYGMNEEFALWIVETWMFALNIKPNANIIIKIKPSLTPATSTSKPPPAQIEPEAPLGPNPSPLDVIGSGVNLGAHNGYLNGELWAMDYISKSKGKIIGVSLTDKKKYPTLWEAVDEAKSGDAIVVEDGLYNETMSHIFPFRKKNLFLISRSLNRDKTVITFDNPISCDSEITFAGFTIVFKKKLLTTNSTFLYLSIYSQLSLYNCAISANAGVCMFAYTNVRLYMHHCQITGFKQRAIWLCDSYAEITDTTFSQNKYAICANGTDISIARCRFSQNKIALFFYGGKCNIEQSAFVDNKRYDIEGDRDNLYLAEPDLELKTKWA